MKTFCENSNCKISLIPPTNNSHAYNQTSFSHCTEHNRARGLSVRSRSYSGCRCTFRMRCKTKHKKTGNKRKRNLPNWRPAPKCNVCWIISLIEFPKAIVLVVTLCIKLHTHGGSVCVQNMNAMWMQISGFVSLKTFRMYLWSSGSEPGIGTHISYPVELLQLY